MAIQIPAALVAMGVKYLAKKGARGLKKFLRDSKQGKRLTEEELEAVRQKTMNSVVKKKRESGEVGYFAKQGTSAQNTSRRLMQESAKKANKNIKDKIIKAGGIGGAAYAAMETGEAVEERYNAQKKKREEEKKRKQFAERRGRTVSETKLSKGGMPKRYSKGGYANCGASMKPNRMSRK